MSINIKDAVYVRPMLFQNHLNLPDLGFTSKGIREMVPIIDPEDDYLMIAAAEERMALTLEARQKELHEAHIKLKRE